MFIKPSEPCPLRNKANRVLSLDSALWGQMWMHSHDLKALNHFTVDFIG
jgi:hypothetical protein